MKFSIRYSHQTLLKPKLAAGQMGQVFLTAPHETPAPSPRDVPLIQNLNVAESVTISTLKVRPLRLFTRHLTRTLKPAKRPSLTESVKVSAKS